MSTYREIKQKMNEALAEMTAINNADEFDAEAYQKAQGKFNDYESQLEEIKKDRELEPENYEKIGSNNLNQENRMNEKNKIYNKADKFYKPTNTDEDISLENFLRSAVDQPKNEVEANAIKNSTTSSGYELPKRVSQQLVDKLRAENPLVRAGAMSTQLKGGETNYITIESTPDSTWHEELNTEQVSSGSFGAISMKPKTLYSSTEISRELIADSNNAEQAITQAFIDSINEEIINASFTGTGTGQPKGLNNSVTQTETYSGSVGYVNLLKANTKLYVSNVSEDNRSVIHAPDMNEDISLEMDDNGRFQQVPPSLEDVASYTNSSVPTGISYMGDFSNILYGWNMKFSIEKYNGVSAQKYGQFWIAVARLDMVTLRPNAFVRIESQ